MATDLMTLFPVNSLVALTFGPHAGEPFTVDGHVDLNTPNPAVRVYNYITDEDMIVHPSGLVRA